MAALMHIVGTGWQGTIPHLIAAQSHGDVHAIEPTGRLDWRVRDGRTCTGYHDTVWHPCPAQAEVGPEGQCLACFRGRGDPRRKDDRPECIFEPRCHGMPQHCVCSFGGVREPVPHVVYLAFHGPLPKVGMTQERRVHRRLVEQGADAYVVVARTADRQAARATETTVARLYGLPEWRTHKETLPQLTRPLERETIARRAHDWTERLRERFPDAGELHWTDHALPVLPGRPVRVQAEGRHVGSWLGAKGNHLFYEAEAGDGHLHVGGRPVHALKRSDLHGRWIETA